MDERTDLIWPILAVQHVRCSFKTSAVSGPHSQCICWEPGDRGQSSRSKRSDFTSWYNREGFVRGIVHRKCSVAFRETSLYELPCLRGLQTFSSYGHGVSQVASALPRPSNSKDVSLGMSGRAWQDLRSVVICDLTLRSRRSNGSLKRYEEQPCDP